MEKCVTKKGTPFIKMNYDELTWLDLTLDWLIQHIEEGEKTPNGCWIDEKTFIAKSMIDYVTKLSESIKKEFKCY